MPSVLKKRYIVEDHISHPIRNIITNSIILNS